MIARLLAAAAVAAVVVVPLASGSRAVFPGKPGKLVFQSARGSTSALYLADADGSGAHALFARPSLDQSHPNWSPTGERIVFLVRASGRSDYDVWTIGADGKDARPLVPGPTSDLWAQYCDTTTVVFTRQVTSSNYEIYSVGTDGRRLRNLTRNPAADFTPTCSPDGKTVYFTSDRDGSQRVYAMTREGKNVHPVTEKATAEPSVSPDGTVLAYVKRDAGGALNVFSEQLASGKTRQVTHATTPGEYRFPKYDPDPGGHALTVTYRDTKTRKEQVRRVAGSTTTLVADGSIGSVQPLPCRCEQLQWRLAFGRQVVLLEPGAATMRLRVSAAAVVTCGHGTGGCDATMTFHVPPAMTRLGVQLHPLAGALGGRWTGPELSCTGSCGGQANRVLFGFDVLGGPQLGFGRRGLDTRSVSLVVVGACHAKQVRSDVTIVFGRDGNVDLGRSDFDGDGVPDGLDKTVVVTVRG
jgi:WD40-like Beta Propeller Repeat